MRRTCRFGSLGSCMPAPGEGQEEAGERRKAMTRYFRLWTVYNGHFALHVAFAEWMCNRPIVVGPFLGKA